jgi:5'-3' exonuclease
MARDRVLIDLNSVAHAAHQGTVLKAGDQETQAVFGTLRTIRTYKARWPHAQFIGLWDGKSWRKAHDPEYKDNRLDDEEKRQNRARFNSQMPFLRKALQYLALPQLFALNLEADDLAALLSKKYSANGDLVRLITGDQDWLQLVTPNVIWEDHRLDERKVNIKNLEKYTGYADVIQFVQAKALEGDVSDNLKGVGGIGEKGSKDLLSVWGRVEAFLADVDPGATWASKGLTKEVKVKGTDQKKVMPKPYPKSLKDFHANVDGRQEKFFHNYYMMNLLGELPKPEGMKLVPGEYSDDRFKSLCHELGFSSIYRAGAFEVFTQPFKGTLQ